MAKQKSNYKGSGSDKFVSRMFIGFAIVFVLLLVSVLIYNSTKITYSYDDYEKITDYGQMLTQAEDKYVVYYYQESCGYCAQIKDEVLAFTESNNEDVKVYLMDVGASMTGTNPFIGTSYAGTPAMHIVVDGAIVNSYSGSISIPEALDRINAGTHEDFQ